VTAVVIPAWRAWATLPAVLEALAPQVRERADREVIVVDSTGDDTPGLIRARWPWVRVVALPERVLPGRARNVGVAATDAEVLAFCDADAVPAPDWLDELEVALGSGLDAVAGAVANGTPASRVGTAMWLLEFSEWLPGRRGRPGHAASCNLAVRRDALAAVGGFPEDLWPGEDTVLTVPWARAGRLGFAPGAVVAHLNRTRPVDLLRHQSRLGTSFRAVCAAVPFPWGFLARRPLAPLAVGLRALALTRRLAGSPVGRRAALRSAPFLAAGLVGWGVGLAVGAGVGGATRA
jgi:GT2 family glycosyltransferase